MNLIEKQRGEEENMQIQRQQSYQEVNKKQKIKIIQLIFQNESRILSNFKIEAEKCKIQPFSDGNQLYNSKVQQQLRDRKNATEDQLCDILSIIKQLNKKTAIQLSIKIMHQILCHLDSQSSENSKQYPISKKFERFLKYEHRLKQYVTNFQRNYFLHTKTETKIESYHKGAQSQLSITELSNKKFLQFSSPVHVLQYFKFQLNSSISLKYIEKESFSQRLQDFNLFKVRGHVLQDYNNDRKTAKIFCLVGPGVKPARQFLGEQLGPSIHCKTVSHIVKIAYRELQSYINENLSYFSDQNRQESNILSHNQNQQKASILLPNYFASRHQVSKLKTPLFNCRNWMNDEQLKLFLMFVKRAYRIVYKKQWLTEKRRQIFLLFGRIIKKLMQREILIRNLEFLKGNDKLELSNGQKYFGIQTQQGIIKLSRKQMLSIQKRHYKKSNKNIYQSEKQKQKPFSREEMFKRKYQQLSHSFRSNF